jgi:hypothetical protein
VAVIDDGFDLEHEDLGAAERRSEDAWDFLDGDADRAFVARWVRLEPLRKDAPPSLRGRPRRGAGRGQRGIA